MSTSQMATEQNKIPRTERLRNAALRMTVHGRTVRLRRLKHMPTGPLALLAILGPGLVAANAGNDAGGIATYASLGAQYGYDLLWLVIIITVSLAIIQETAGRLGAATGRGLLDLIRERFGIGWALFAVSIILIANGGLIISEFVGIGAAVGLFGFPNWIAVPLAGLLIWWMVTGGSYRNVEKVFILMTLVFFAYPISAFLAKPDWGQVAIHSVVPTIRSDPKYIAIIVATIGTTITPYMQIFQESAIVEKGVARSNYAPEALDAYIGSIFSNVISFFIIVATAATLHQQGKTDINSAADAAQALQPIAGQFASVLFGTGLLGASMLAAAVLPLATAYAISETFGFRKGVDLNFRRAPVFFGIFTGLLVLAVLVALIPGLPVIELLVGIQVLNGMLLPAILIFMLLLVNDSRLMGNLKNGPARNVISWATAIVIILATVVMLANTLLGNG